MVKYNVKNNERTEVMEDNEIFEFPKPSKTLTGFFDILESLVYAIIVVILTFTFFAKLTVVDGESMMDTLKHGDYLVVIDPLFLYEPDNQDIIVIQGDFAGDYYDHPIVKRVIAKGGQTVKIDFLWEKIYVDGVELEESGYINWDGHRLEPTLGDFKLDENGNVIRDEDGFPEVVRPYYDGRIFEATVPEGHYFVMGDNRYYSADSRLLEIGFIPEKYILGKAIYRLFPFSSMGALY